MEIETIIAHGCENALREFMTVKSDDNEEKRELTKQIINNGNYEMVSSGVSNGKTKQIVNVLIKFLKE